MKDIVTYSASENQLYEDVRAIIEEARANAIRSVDFNSVLMYWKTGRRVFEEEQKGAERADYGSFLIERLAQRLEPGYGSGFSKRQLHFSVQFYKAYPKVNALRSQLNWTQYSPYVCNPNKNGVSFPEAHEERSQGFRPLPLRQTPGSFS